MTEKQREVLAQQSISGVCVRGVWTWLANGRPVTRQAKALVKLGYMHAAYYRGGQGAMDITEAGRAALQEAA